MIDLIVSHPEIVPMYFFIGLVFGALVWLYNSPASRYTRETQARFLFLMWPVSLMAILLLAAIYVIQFVIVAVIMLRPHRAPNA